MERGESGVAILISDKIVFKDKAIRRYREEHYNMIKGTIQQEDITLVNIYTPDIGTPKYVKQVLMNIKGEINRNISGQKGVAWNIQEWKGTIYNQGYFTQQGYHLKLKEKQGTSQTRKS